MVETYSRPRSSGSSYEDYPRGYEPSAPPYHSAPDYHPSSPHASPADEFEQRLHRRQEDEFPRNPREPFFGPADEHETLGSYLVHRLIQPVWRGSRTVLRIDLSRSLKYNGPVVGRGRGGGVGGPSGASASVGGRDYYDGKDDTHTSRGWLSGIQGGGARLKLMQVWDAPQNMIGEARKHWDINFGFGINVELDKGRLHPKLRLKARHVALHLLPVPEIELRGKWPLGGTRLAINAKYRIPLATTFEEIWSSTGARLMISFFNPLGTGVHLTPGGLEFDEHLIRLGEHTKLRLAASVDFPRKFPLEEGEQPVRLRVHRLGLKTLIMPTTKENNPQLDGSHNAHAV
ncbi:hypothetical protein MPTK1_1g11750 [Marchantia polymorpha subsp. ruderalis]|uniref:Uncharacterized protein n=2 Tax=Marchantia polymorpha TaxID=3197 RepID=A0A176WMF6_MARPO|nr:hypothetical protein AXG93_3822s1180 [Marchantia polymorpha subsp. ruderalis]PTQ45508.1 hypothetical protein MARPO_0014s0052 [Marchantia polymorpha]BBM98212.1 hypothetical protein Mp_1g11750 [Marchantia polymorpha subsp. ruderalis]|eukprot:PTQ45508.1 hypothetical protein MARPO_0014s0052 [Marchantia polymorpha]